MLPAQHRKKRWYNVYVNASLRLTQKVVRMLMQKHDVVRRSDGRRRFQALDVFITEKGFRSFQEKLHRKVGIAYELREPE